MSLNKIIGAAALTFCLGLSSCTSKYEDYRFYGKINGEQINFIPSEGGRNELTVLRTDGVRIKYYDWANCDLKIDLLEMVVNGVTLEYRTSDPNWPEVSTEAQKQFDNYLLKIKEEKERIKQSGVEILKSKSIFREGE